MTYLNCFNERRRYFAAQNSYLGFISHFPKVFNSEEYERIFVLKGGPGTGKSSFMKRAADELAKSGELTEIYCSSDEASLDGIIVCGARGKIAILDGTSPHERDAVIPGAIDELINLGEYWNSSELIREREKIIALHKKKSKSYKSAYSHLKLAGKYHALLRSEILASFDSFRAREYAAKLAVGEKEKWAARRSLLLSAFGKGGYITLGGAYAGFGKITEITGEYCAAEIFMELLCEELKRLGIAHEEYPSPLSPAITEAVVIKEGESTHCYTLLPATEKISAGKFLRSLSAKEVELRHYERVRLENESKAMSAFADASCAHFELEKIYTPTMNFEKIGELIEKTVQKAKSML